MKFSNALLFVCVGVFSLILMRPAGAGDQPDLSLLRKCESEGGTYIMCLHKTLGLLSAQTPKERPGMVLYADVLKKYLEETSSVAEVDSTVKFLIALALDGVDPFEIHMSLGEACSGEPIQQSFADHVNCDISQLLGMLVDIASEILDDPLGSSDLTKNEERLAATKPILQRLAGVGSTVGNVVPCTDANGRSQPCLPQMAAIILINEIWAQSNPESAAINMSKFLKQTRYAKVLYEDAFFVRFIVDSSDRVALSVRVGDDTPRSVVDMLTDAFDISYVKLGGEQITADIANSLLRSASGYGQRASTEPFRERISHRAVKILEAISHVSDGPTRDDMYDQAAESFARLRLEDLSFQALVARFDAGGNSHMQTLLRAQIVGKMITVPGRETEAIGKARKIAPELLKIPRDTTNLATRLYELATSILYAQKPKILKEVCLASPEIDLAIALLRYANSILDDQRLSARFLEAGIAPITKSLLGELEDPAREPSELRFSGVFNCLKSTESVSTVSNNVLHHARLQGSPKILLKAYIKSINIAYNFITDTEIDATKTKDDLDKILRMTIVWANQAWLIEPIDEEMEKDRAEVDRLVRLTADEAYHPQELLELVDQHLNISRARADSERVAELLGIDISLRTRAIRPKRQNRGIKMLVELLARRGHELQVIEILRKLQLPEDEFFDNELFQHLSLSSLKTIKYSMLNYPVNTSELNKAISAKAISNLSGAELIQYSRSGDESEILMLADVVVPALVYAGGPEAIKRLIIRLSSRDAIGTVVLEAVRKANFKTDLELERVLLPEDNLRIITSQIENEKSKEIPAEMVNKAVLFLSQVTDVSVKHVYSADLARILQSKGHCAEAVRFSSAVFDSMQPSQNRFTVTRAIIPFFRCGYSQKAYDILTRGGLYSNNVDILSRIAKRLFNDGETVHAWAVLSIAIHAAENNPNSTAFFYDELFSAATLIQGPDFAGLLSTTLFSAGRGASDNLVEDVTRERGEARKIIARSLFSDKHLQMAADFIVDSQELPIDEKIRFSADMINSALDEGVALAEVPATMRTLLRLNVRGVYEDQMITRVKALARLGELELAIDLAESLRSPDDRVNGLLAVAEALSVASRQGKYGLKLYEMAFECANLAGDASNRTELFTKIADHYWEVDVLRNKAVNAALASTNDFDRVRIDIAELLRISAAVQAEGPSAERFSNVLVSVGKALERINWDAEVASIKRLISSNRFFVTTSRAKRFLSSDESVLSLPLSVSARLAQLLQKSPEEALQDINEYSSDGIEDLPIFRAGLNIARDSFTHRLSRDPLAQIVTARAEPILSSAIAEKYLHALSKLYLNTVERSVSQSIATEALEVMASSHQTVASTAYFRGLALRQSSPDGASEFMISEGSKWARLREAMYLNLENKFAVDNSVMPSFVDEATSSARAVLQNSKTIISFIQSFSNELTNESLSAREKLERLGPDEALIHYRIIGDSTYVVVATNEHTRLYNLTNREFDNETLFKLVAKLQESMTTSLESMTSGSELSDNYPFDFEASTELYLRLIEPLLPAISSKKRLILIPDGVLAEIPFALLTANDKGRGHGLELLKSAPWLIKKFSLETAPTLAMWRASAVPHHRSTFESFLGLGDPALGPSRNEVIDCDAVMESASNRRLGNEDSIYLPGASGVVFQIADPKALNQLVSLPEAGCELNYIGSKFIKSEVWTQKDARENRLKELSSAGVLRGYDVIAFATHAVGSNGANSPGLVLTPLGNPSGEDDGLLTDIEIGRLHIDARLVILSACSTAKAGAISQEAFSGLTSSFLLAGARNVLASFWDVDSKASARTIARMMDVSASGVDEDADALQESMKMTLASATSIREAHPVYWAPFTVVTTD